MASKVCRSCTSGYHSVIMLREPVSAGLSDRAVMFRSMGNLAASLCAALVVSRPCHALKAMHNKGRRLSCDVPWSRYFSSHDMCSLQGISNSNHCSYLHGKRCAEAVIAPNCSWYGGVANQLISGPRVTLRSQMMSSSVTATYDLAVKELEAGRRFTWLFTGYWPWRVDLSNHIERSGLRSGYSPPSLLQQASGGTSCGPIMIGPSQLVVDLCESYMSHLGQRRAMVAVHVRRGDRTRYLQRCNTTAAAVARVVAVELQKASTVKGGLRCAACGHASSPLALLVFTDERSTAYLEELRSLLTAAVRLPIRLLISATKRS
jgi:hypothetical protein